MDVLIVQDLEFIIQLQYLMTGNIHLMEMLTRNQLVLPVIQQNVTDSFNSKPIFKWVMLIQNIFPHVMMESFNSEEISLLYQISLRTNTGHIDTTYLITIAIILYKSFFKFSSTVNDVFLVMSIERLHLDRYFYV